jgi:hypothetical protein
MGAADARAAVVVVGQNLKIVLDPSSLALVFALGASVECVV